MPGETRNPFSLTRAVLSKRVRRKSKFLSINNSIIGKSKWLDLRKSRSKPCGFVVGCKQLVKGSG